MREICPDFLVRTMRLRWTPEGSASGGEEKREEERTVCQFHYSAWPDHGIPTQVRPLLEMVRLIRDCQASETLPVLIHCSAGCGRTGTICAIDYIWGLLRTGRLSAGFSLYELVRDMRRQRVAMVQTVDQYILVHRAVRELFLEQLRVIDSHPYENVDGDGNPLCGNGRDEVQPEYETIFVKEEEESDIDRILTQRMAQLPKTVMGTAMLSRDSRTNSSVGSTASSSRSQGGGGGRTSPPLPPPKQKAYGSNSTPRNKENGAHLRLETSALVKSRRLSKSEDSTADLAPVEEFIKKSSPVLFEPALPPGENRGGAAQRFRKGNLRLKQADNGAWKLEDLGDKESSSSERVIVVNGKGGGSSSSSKQKKSGKEDDSPKSELFRRPSIKKLRAFFSKDKSRTSPSKDAPSSSEDDQPQSDADIAAAMSKVPKPVSSSVMAASKSVPSSLDRRVMRRDPDYVNVQRDSSLAVEDEDEKQRNASGERGHSPGLQKTLSIERLNGVEGRPSLPIKRSKSMKTVSKALTTPSPEESQDAKEKRRWSFKHKAQSEEPSPEQFYSLPVEHDSQKKHRSFEDASSRENLPPMGKSGRRSDEGKSGDSSDYANVRLKRDSLPDDRLRERFLEQHLARLHAKVTAANLSPEEDASIPTELRRSLPVIARASASLDDDARRMLRDCQDYLASSFGVVDREGERFMALATRNRSAESSPMTTLQKHAHLSSHSTPSNSYNKYGNKNNSPGSVLQAVKKGPSGAVQKKFCSPARSSAESFSATPGPPSTSPLLTAAGVPSASVSSTKKISPGAAVSPRHEGQQQQRRRPQSHHQPPSRHRERHQDERDYANVITASPKAMATVAAVEAQRKVSEAGTPSGRRSKERRNSFREAVEKGKADEEDGQGGIAYESIWFEGKEQSSHSKDKSRGQRAEPQSSGDRNGGRRGRKDVYSGCYDNVVLPSDAGGYEPVRFREGRGAERPNSGHQLQSVGLVAEVLNRASHERTEIPAPVAAFTFGQAASAGMSKSNSSSSVGSGGNGGSLPFASGRAQPPPYKEPPQPLRSGAGEELYAETFASQHRPTSTGYTYRDTSNDNRNAPPESSGTYVNVSYGRGLSARTGKF